MKSSLLLFSNFFKKPAKLLRLHFLFRFLFKTLKENKALVCVLLTSLALINVVFTSSSSSSGPSSSLSSPDSTTKSSTFASSLSESSSRGSAVALPVSSSALQNRDDDQSIREVHNRYNVIALNSTLLLWLASLRRRCVRLFSWSRFSVRDEHLVFVIEAQTFPNKETSNPEFLPQFVSLLKSLLKLVLLKILLV